VARLGKKGARRTSRFTQLALTAADEAIQDSHILERRPAPLRVGVVLGVGFGGLETVEKSLEALRTRGARAISPYALPSLIANTAPASIAIEIGAKGPCYVTTASCASGAIAVANAFELVRAGALDVVVAGGAEAAVTPLAIAGFERLGALSKARLPIEASRPFDLHREGFVMGEGAGVVVLEPLDRARAARVPIHAEIVGYGMTADAHHVTAPDPGGTGAASAMSSALKMAEMAPSDIDYLNAHGTGTRNNDAVETSAIKATFGAHANDLWISSTKSMTGHLLGAAGAVEIIVAVLSIEQGVVPPTSTLRTPDPACDLDYVPRVARERRIVSAMTNSFGFGGHNCSLVVRGC